MEPDFVVWSAEGSEAALVVLIGGWNVGSPATEDARRDRTRQQLADYMNKIGCRHALVVSRGKTLVLRRESGPSATGDLTEVALLPTAQLFGAPVQPSPEAAVSAERLDHLVEAWLKRLVGSGADALPNERGIRDSFPPEVIEAARGGRVVWEMVEECKRRLASDGPWYTGEQVEADLRALQAEWDRTGGFDETYMYAFLERLRSGGPQ
jgi:hypothetical protein